ncbi:DEKNAAC104075 [Brettanomyces naardenensis]|uniref:DEKNAAC104075 n=1 Tax=Brettanomyces naardenensis TaxID=13370 RepID=A0A448YQF6_BRENA|nr:DEKNAAC104075 [Brettanomyces naardenensis]
MDCLGAWIAYASKAEFDSTVRYDFTSLLQFTIQVMASSSSSSPAMETLLDTLYTNPTFLKAETKLQLQSLIFGSWGSQFLSYQSEDSDQFARLTILFLEPDITSLAVKLADDSNDDKFDFLLRLTNFPGTPIVEESISNEFIDFWMQFADCFIEDDDRLSTMTKGDKLQNLHSKSRAFFIKVSQIYWSKIHIPQELEGFHDEFRIYRRDVGDLFESIFPIVKFPLYNNLIDNVLTSLNGTVSLSDIEASLYLINAIGSDFTENNIQSDALESVGKILDSDYLQLVTKQMIPNRFQHLVYTTVRFVSTIDWFYKSEKGLQYLPSMLNFLFDTMSMSAYQLISSKAISDICDNCRSSLQGLLPEFKTIIEQMVNDYTVEPLTRERVMNSYASIIQGVKDPSTQGAYLEEVVRLLGKLSFEVIETTDIINSTAASATDGTIRTVDYLTSLLSSLSSLGKGMQLPDSADEIYQPSEIEAVNQYWQQDPLKIHSQILEIINNFSMGNPGLADNLGVTEEIVHIFKSGLTETVGGPFVFNQAVIVQFIVAKFHTLQTTNTYPLLYGLYSSVIKAYHREMDVESVGRTLQIIFIDRISIIQTDPDIIQSVLNLLGTILSTRPSLLVSNIDMLEKVLAFGIDQLRSSERFVLRSLEYFWTKLIYLRRGNREDTVVVRRLFNETKLGYLATFNVLKYLLVTQRSNLEFFTEILKGLVAKYPMLVKGWLTESFREINEERERRGEKRIGGYDVFVKKMMISRGSRAGNEVVKDFWLEVNGLIDY